MSRIYTIGFTKKSAEIFFGLLKSENISTLIDVRLNNASQLAGFAKKDDLRFFLRELCGIEYIHMPRLAPTKDILNAYKKGDLPWKKYEEMFFNLMTMRQVEKMVKPALIENSCLLCSEHKPEFCHRRLIVKYLNDNSEFNLEVKHLS